MKLKLLFLSGVLLFSSSYAGFNRLTHHSRANCLTINESISWSALGSYELYVSATHYKKMNGTTVDSHRDNTPHSITWRQGVVHFNEAHSPYTWSVSGYHTLYKNGVALETLRTNVEDCDIYDGWWDNDHPERKS